MPLNLYGDRSLDLIQAFATYSPTEIALFACRPTTLVTQRCGSPVCRSIPQPTTSNLEDDARFATTLIWHWRLQRLLARAASSAPLRRVYFPTQARLRQSLCTSCRTLPYIQTAIESQVSSPSPKQSPSLSRHNHTAHITTSPKSLG